MSRAKIDHVVVLMLENRSFDHMLGFLDHPNPKFVRLGPSNDNDDGQGGRIVASDDAQATIVVGPGHEHGEVMRQLSPHGELNNDGFVIDYDRLAASKGYADVGYRIMQCQHPNRIPVLATLAKEFAVCTRWHCSVPGMTWPNRNFAHAATSDGEVDIKHRPFDNPTIFEQLSDEGKDWRVFSDNSALNAQAKVFPKLWASNGRNRFQGINKFYRLASRNALPHYSFIEPDHMWGFSSSQHPMNNVHSDHDFYAGEKLIADIYAALTSNIITWQRSLFIITYDEHGGFYDRMPPPQDAGYEVEETHGDGDDEFRFDLLGPRVPAVVVSPYIDQGTVDEEIHDHTSIISTVRELLIPHTDPLNNREANIAHVADLLTRTEPRDEVPELKPLERADSLAFERMARRMDDSVKDEMEMDEFQESLIWLSEYVESQLSGADASNASASALERIDTAKSMEHRVPTPERLVILRTAEKSLEQPTESSINDHVTDDAAVEKVWLDDLSGNLLEWFPEGKLVFSYGELERGAMLDVQTAQRCFKLFCQGELNSISEAMGG